MLRNFIFLLFTFLSTTCLSQQYTFLINIDSVIAKTMADKVVDSQIEDRITVLQKKFEEGYTIIQKRAQRLWNGCGAPLQMRRASDKFMQEQDNLIRFQVFIEDTFKIYREEARKELNQIIFDQAKQYLKEKNISNYSLIEIKSSLYYNKELDITSDYIEWLKMKSINYDFLKELDKKYKVPEKSKFNFTKPSPYGIPFYMNGHPRDKNRLF